MSPEPTEPHSGSTRDAPRAFPPSPPGAALFDPRRRVLRQTLSKFAEGIRLLTVWGTWTIEAAGCRAHSLRLALYLF